MEKLLLLPLLRLPRGRRYFKLKKRLRPFLLLLIIDLIVTTKHLSIQTYVAAAIEVIWLSKPTTPVAVLLLLCRSTHVFVLRTLPSIVSALFILHHSAVHTDVLPT